MGVGDGGHGVDLEVLVRSDLRHLLDGSPVGEGGLSIVKPLVAQVLHVVVVQVGHSLGYFGTGQSSPELQDLVADFGGDVAGALTGQQTVVQVVAASEDFHVIEIVGVDGRKTDSAVIHLSGEDFISKEGVSEDSTVGVGHVVGVSSGYIDEVSEQGMHRVVLFLHVVQVLSVLVNAVGTEHVLQKQEGVVVGVLHGGRVVEHSYV